MSIRHVFATMGTTVSLHAEQPIASDILSALEAAFAGYDERFSLYRPQSELSRIASGHLALTASSPQLRDVYADALLWRSRTNGAFTPHRPDGVIDLSGIVKALAMRDAAALLENAGDHSWNLGCGGDLIARHPPQQRTRVGIVDPSDRTRTVATVELIAPRRAVATSGVSERGEHVWGPRTDFDQVTVVADDIVTADVCATAILAGGRETHDQLSRALSFEVLAVDRAGELLRTPGLSTPAL